MQDAPDECLGLFCQFAANEQDPQKLIELVRIINKLVEEKHKNSISAGTKEVDGNSGLPAQGPEPSPELRDTAKTEDFLGRSANK